MRKIMIGVMGPGELATPKQLEQAYQLGKLIAQNNWVLLTGGRNAGVMNAASLGAKDVGGLTVGILPSRNTQDVSEAVAIAIVTDLGNARNNVNVLSSDVVIACGMGMGTASEVALAIKNGKPVILLNVGQESQQFFKSLAPEKFLIATSPQQAIELVQQILTEQF